MSDIKTLAEWEQQKNFFIKDATDTDLQEQITEDDFDAIPMDEKLGIIYADRVAFLQNNGYEVTRENLFNIDLVATNFTPPPNPLVDQLMQVMSGEADPSSLDTPPSDDGNITVV